MPVHTPVVKQVKGRQVKRVTWLTVVGALLYLLDQQLEQLVMRMQQPDSVFDMWLGYGICGVAIVYFLGSIIRLCLM